MKICKKVVNYLQVVNSEGDVSICPCLKEGGIIGNLKKNSLYEIYHGEAARRIREKLANNDYSLCDIDCCRYLARNEIEDFKVEVDEIPELPEILSLSYEQVCNYNCICCGLDCVMKEKQGKNLNPDYDTIEKQLKTVLPHIEILSANGNGELFLSQRTLNILENWKPLNKKEDIKVILETNGSLFDELHWKQIEHLGQYHLRVSITVMSFDEHIYQILSGCKYPISKIESNLRFVKSLREKSIINELELATVVQERNFRTLPEFVRKCIEEFSADTVRLRPYIPYNSQPIEIEWFADVRNTYHPYNSEYLEIMKHPIFKHPKVRDWSGGLPSHSTGEYPYKMMAKEIELESQRNGITSVILNQMIINKQGILNWIQKLMKERGTEKIAVYGYGIVGKSLVETIKDNVVISNIYDRHVKNVRGVTIPNRAKLSQERVIIITPIMQFERISAQLVKEYGCSLESFIPIEAYFNN